MLYNKLRHNKILIIGIIIVILNKNEAFIQGESIEVYNSDIQKLQINT